MLQRLALAAVFGLAATAAHAQTAAYKLGDTVPATLAFTDAEGATHTLGEYRGKPVVLEWTNAGCPFVRKHYDSGNMQQLQKSAAAKGAAWVSVISSAPGKQGYLKAAEAPAAVAQSGFAGTAVALDPSGTLGKAFGAETTPHMFVLDATGKLVYRGAIDSIPSFNREDIAKADNYVAAALADVLAGKPVTTPQTRPYGCSVKY